MATAQPLTTYYHSNQKVFLPPSSLYFNPHCTAARLTPENSFNHYIPNSKSPSTEAKGIGLHSKQYKLVHFYLELYHPRYRYKYLMFHPITCVSPNVWILCSSSLFSAWMTFPSLSRFLVILKTKIPEARKPTSQVRCELYRLWIRILQSLNCLLEPMRHVCTVLPTHLVHEGRAHPHPYLYPNTPHSHAVGAQ